MRPPMAAVIWSDLPKPIWEHIFQLLDSLLDRIRFNRVCPLFRSVAKQQPHRLSRPLLLLPPSSETPETVEFFSLSDTHIYKSHIPELQSKWCCGSAFGWLFTVDFNSGEISLINPISRTQISLPPLSSFSEPQFLQGQRCERNNIRFIQKTTVSSSPGKSNDFIVMTIITNAWSLAFCKPGDNKWVNLPSIHGGPGGCFWDAIYHKGKFYAVTHWDALIAWDLSDVDLPTVTIIIESTRDEPIVDKLYLVESIHGELFKIHRRVENGNEDGNWSSYQTVEFLVYKLDEENRRWVDASLCGQSVFLGYNRAICLSTLENPECREYGIYFTDDDAFSYEGSPHGCNDVGLYNSKDGSVEKFYENHPMWTTPCIWITQSLR